MAVEAATTHSLKEKAPSTSTSGLLGLLKGTSTLQLLTLIFQAVAAGSMMAGSDVARTMHGVGAFVVHGSGLLLLIGAILYWRPGRGPGWPALFSAAILLAGLLQSMMGGSGNLAVHVPLAVALVTLATWLTGWSWSRRSMTAS